MQTLHNVGQNSRIPCFADPACVCDQDVSSVARKVICPGSVHQQVDVQVTEVMWLYISVTVEYFSDSAYWFILELSSCRINACD